MPKTVKAAKECLECGASLAGLKKPGDFCSSEHRHAWHNRRKVRGAELYDVAMAWRFERNEPDTYALLTRLLSAYRDADKSLRAGRKSWKLADAKARIPLGYSTDGDGR